MTSTQIFPRLTQTMTPSSPGDGIIFEVYNGLMKRQDRVEAIKMPLAIIPGGSGKILIR